MTSEKSCPNCGTTIPEGKIFCPKCTGGYKHNPYLENDVETPGAKNLNEEKLNNWSESLRTKLIWFAVILGVLYSLVTVQIIGPLVFEGQKDWGVGFLIISILGPTFLCLFIYHNIWVRQLALPGIVFGIFYSFSHYDGFDLFLKLSLLGLGLVTMIMIGLTEAHATTRKFQDFWRSYLFHPLGWAEHFGISPNID